MRGMVRSRTARANVRSSSPIPESRVVIYPHREYPHTLDRDPARRPMPAAAARYSIGLDFGTESVRVVVVDIANGNIAGQASSAYAHGVMDGALVVNDAQIPLP